MKVGIQVNRVLFDFYAGDMPEAHAALAPQGRDPFQSLTDRLLDGPDLVIRSDKIDFTLEFNRLTAWKGGFDKK